MTIVAGLEVGSLWDGLEKLRVPLATALALLGIAALLYAVRRSFLAWHARKPRVQITTFGWTGATDESVREAAWVTSLFRDQLVGLKLDALDPLPERAPGAPLLEIFAGVGQGSAVGKALAGIFKVVKPDCAYSVWGTLRPHDKGDGGHLSVELVDGLSHRTLLSATLTADDWATCARDAAMAVAGALYPRISRHDRGPWGQWTRTVPRTLVTSYQDAAAHDYADRLEEALDGYHVALQQDPLNPHLRICIAMVQERLGLYLDAWATYQAITTETNRRAWKGGERRTRLVAQYRLAILLGYEEAGQQWLRSQRPVQSVRDRERQTLRAELAVGIVREPLFARDGKSPKTRLDKADAGELWLDWRERVEALQLDTQIALPPELSREPARTMTALLCGHNPLADDWEDHWPYSADDRLRWRDRPADAGVPRVDVINELLQILGLRRFEELCAWQRPWPPWRDIRSWRIHRPGLRHIFAAHEIAGDALEVSSICRRLRLRASRYSTTGPGTDDGAMSELMKAPIFDVSGHGSRTRRHRWWPPHRPGRRSDDWLTSYNAACTVAVPLVPKLDTATGAVPLPLPRGIMKSDLVTAALAHLERYAHTAGSARFASQEAWITAEDPDLIGLAKYSKFHEWARHHLGEPLPKRRPVRSIDVGYHLRCVLQRGARASAERWQRRAANGSAPAAIVAGWWRDDAAMWSVFADACVEFRSWRIRLAAVRAVNEQLVAAGEPPVGAQPGWRETSEVANPHLHEERVGRIAILLRPASQTGVLAWVQERQRVVREAIEAGAVRIGDGDLRTDAEREAALLAFRLWSRLAEALDPGAGEPARARLAVVAATLDLGPES
jgi:hypothetical protein